MSCPSFRKVNGKVFLQLLVVVVGDKMAKKMQKTALTDLLKEAIIPLQWTSGDGDQGHSLGVGAAFLPVKAAQGCFEARS